MRCRMIWLNPSHRIQLASDVSTTAEASAADTIGQDGKLPARFLCPNVQAIVAALPLFCLQIAFSSTSFWTLVGNDASIATSFLKPWENCIFHKNCRHLLGVFAPQTPHKGFCPQTHRGLGPQTLSFLSSTLNDLPPPMRRSDNK